MKIKVKALALVECETALVRRGIPPGSGMIALRGALSWVNLDEEGTLGEEKKWGSAGMLEKKWSLEAA